MSDRPSPARESSPHQRAPGAVLNRPLWQRYVISLSVAAVLLVALVLWVEHHNTNTAPSESNPAATVRANKEAEVLVAQDEAPHAVSFPAHTSGSEAVARVIHARIAAQVRSGALAGPLRPARCRPTGARRGSAVAYSCTVETGSVFYPYLAVADAGTRRVTYCKRDPPPIPSESVPVSRRCRL